MESREARLREGTQDQERSEGRRLLVISEKPSQRVLQAEEEEAGWSCVEAEKGN